MGGYGISSFKAMIFNWSSELLFDEYPLERTERKLTRETRPDDLIVFGPVFMYGLHVSLSVGSSHNVCSAGVYLSKT